MIILIVITSVLIVGIIMTIIIIIITSILMISSITVVIRALFSFLLITFVQYILCIGYVCIYIYMYTYIRIYILVSSPPLRSIISQEPQYLR